MHHGKPLTHRAVSVPGYSLSCRPEKKQKLGSLAHMRTLIRHMPIFVVTLLFPSADLYQNASSINYRIHLPLWSVMSMVLELSNLERHHVYCHRGTLERLFNTLCVSYPINKVKFLTPVHRVITRVKHDHLRTGSCT